MDPEAAIVSLLTTGDVGTAISGRISEAGMPQGLARPNIIYQRIGTRRRYTNDGPVNMPRATFQITCWADSIAAARALAGKVRVRLSGFKGVVGTATINAIFLTDEMAVPTQVLPGTDQSFRGVTFDAAIHFKE